MKALNICILISMFVFSSLALSQALDRDQVKREMLEEAKAVRSKDGIRELTNKHGQTLIDEAKKAKVEVADDPESLAAGLYGKKKEVLNVKAENKVLSDESGNLQHVVKEGESDFDRFKMTKTLKDNSLIPVAEAAEDLMEAQAAGRSESKEISIGDEKIDLVEIKSCPYTELSQRVEFNCETVPKIACTDVSRPVEVRGGAVFLPSQELEKGHWRFFYTDNALASRNTVWTDSISLVVPKLSQIANVRISALRYEDQVDIAVNGTYLFRGIGPKHYQIVTPTDASFPAWETIKYSAGGGGGGGGAGCVGVDHHGPGGGDGPFMEIRPECEPAGGGSIMVTEFKDFGTQIGPDLDITPYLREGANTISVRLAVGNNRGKATDGDINLDLTFSELCTLGETAERRCKGDAGLTSITAVSGPTCTGGPQTLTVEGQNYSVACSKYTEVMSGLTAPELIKGPECDNLRPPECYPQPKVCNRTSDLGCEEGVFSYQCTKRVPKTVVKLESDQFQGCPNGSCVEDDKAIEQPAFEDMDKLLAAEADSQGKDKNDLRIFTGLPLTCGKALAIVGLRDCCDDNGILKGLTKCSATEKQLAMSKQQNLAFRIGTYRTGSDFRRRKHEAWCQFDSMVSKIVAEYVFTNMRGEVDVGGKDNWNCRFVKPEMIRRINFDTIDWSPLKESLQVEKKAKDSIDSMQQNVANTKNFKGTKIEKIIEEKIKDRFIDELESAE